MPDLSVRRRSCTDELIHIDVITVHKESHTFAVECASIYLKRYMLTVGDRSVSRWIVQPISSGAAICSGMYASIMLTHLREISQTRCKLQVTFECCHKGPGALMPRSRQLMCATGFSWTRCMLLHRLLTLNQLRSSADLALPLATHI
jgi:hypothetical protein